MPVEEPKSSPDTEKPGEAKAEAPGRKSLLVPLLVFSLVAAGAGYAVAAFVLKPMLGPPTAAHAPVAESAAEEGQGQIIRFENIVVNPSGTMGSRYLSTTVGLEVRNEETEKIILQSEPRIKDALITHLSSRTIDELTDAQTREEIRKAILALVNQSIAPQKVAAVYFLDFVLQ